jgi:hypothetical protein
MPTQNYITLTSDDTTPGPPTFGGKYAVIVQDPGWQINLRKAQSVDETIEGGLDVGMGGIYETIQYMIRTRETEPDTEYGDLADLRGMFELNNPSGTPSNLLKLEDHYGNDVDVWMLGQFNQRPLTVIIEGENAWFYIPIQLQVQPA